MTETKDAEFYTIKGKRYDRVTSVLRARNLIDFSKIPERGRQYYLDRGTQNHLAWQMVEEGTAGGFDFDPEVQKYMPAHARFLYETGFNALPKGIELRIQLDEFMVAGRLDRLGTIRHKLVLIDYKTTSVHDATRIQTAIYLLGVLKMPRFSKYQFSDFDRYGVAFRNDGKYAMSLRYPYSDKDEALYHLSQYRKENPYDAH